MADLFLIVMNRKCQIIPFTVLLLKLAFIQTFSIHYAMTQAVSRYNGVAVKE